MFEIDLKDFFRESLGSVRDFQISGILQKKIQPFLTDKLKISGSILATRQIDSAKVSGQIEYQTQAKCDRCQKDFTYQNFQSFAREISDEELRHLKFGQYSLSDDIIESIIINKPIVVVCKADCLGLCSRCGSDLNIKSCNCQQDEQIKNNPFKVLKRNNYGSTKKENLKSQNR